jgi:uncharacterized secreted protein with C-terminal beta-propeller domain
VTARRSLALATLAVSLACTSGSKPRAPDVPAPVPVDRSPRLHAATSCGELETAIEDAVVLEMRSQLEQLRITWSGGTYPPIATAGGPANASPTPGPSSYTTTNSQVAGVDEADFVQNDGTRIAALADGRLHLVSSWPADAMAEASSLPIEGWPQALFLAGNQVVVFSSVYVPRALEGDHPICAAPAGPMPIAYWCGYYYADVTKITTVDVTSLGAPAVTAEIYLPGSYLTARRIDARVRVVTTDSFPYPDGVQLWPDLSGAASQSDRDQAFAALEAKNEALIRARTLDDWLRRGSVKHADGTTTDLSYACTDFALGAAPVHPGILTVATLDLDTQSLVSSTSALARADVVYASQNTLYAAAGHWWWWPLPGQTDATYIHAFDLTNPDQAPYLASGVVDGSVDDQYQLDELQGALRVASTLQTRVDDGTPWGRLAVSNQIAVLGLSGGALETIGKTGPFGDGERLFGTRFVGTRGFAITARQVDPLFTFDLSDPTHPLKVGELSMPGFIAYLHPIDDTHLLGVGRELAGPSGPMQVKVQLLDVSDLAAPTSVSTALVGEGWSWSESLWDPKAFTWFPAKSLLAIPFADFASDGFVSDLRLFLVDPFQGITPDGVLSMADVYQTVSGPGWSFSWSPYVRRGILADDFVYAVSDAGIRSAMVADLPSWLRTVTFTPLPAP